jgi:large subunit ribosomal protein L6
MSRIGKLQIALPKGVTASYDAKGNKVSVKGPKGELHQELNSGYSVEVEGSTLKVKSASEENSAKAKHGLYRSLIANMVEGVNNGYRREMELIGVGYKASAQGNVLELSIGYSHNVFLAVPKELKLQAVQEKGQNPMIILEGIDKQLIGQVAAKIKSLRKVEPYKGKGIRYVGEYVRRKAGKAAAK